MSGHTLHVPGHEPPMEEIPPVLQHRCELSGLRIHALPPGPIDVHCHLQTNVLDINLSDVICDMRVNSDRSVTKRILENSYSYAPRSTELAVRANNGSWGALVELDADRLSSIYAEAFNGHDPLVCFVAHTPSIAIAALGRHIVAHLRGCNVNRLYVEGLSIAALGLVFGRGIEAALMVQIGSEDARIARATEYAETHIGKTISVAELAAVACLSPGHFSRTFKATTGEAVWAYVQRRRCERARDMLLATKKPIAQIAFDCGFANQAHLTRQLSARFGTTPRAIRRGN